MYIWGEICYMSSKDGTWHKQISSDCNNKVGDIEYWILDSILMELNVIQWYSMEPVILLHYLYRTIFYCFSAVSFLTLCKVATLFHWVNNCMNWYESIHSSWLGSQNYAGKTSVVMRQKSIVCSVVTVSILSLELTREGSFNMR